jgi:hypothetical protein
MAEVFAIIGAIAACQQLLTRVTKAIKALAMAGKEQDSMVLRLNHHAILLQGFSDHVAEFGSGFDSDLRNHFDVVLQHMQIVLENTLAKMEKAGRKKPSKLLWVLAGNDLKESEKELFEWSQRLMIAFAFMSTPLKTNLVHKFSSMTDAHSLPSWLLGLKANIRMEKGKNDVSAVVTDQISSRRFDEPVPWNSLDPKYLDQLWFDRIKTDMLGRRGTMTIDEVRLEVGRLFAVLKEADSVSNRILSAKLFLITDDPQYQFAIASTLPSDTCNRQLLSEMLVEPSKHVSIFHIAYESIDNP